MKLEELYYDQGFFISNISQDINALLWNEVYTTEWVCDTEDNIYKQIPSWYKGSKKYYLDPSGKNRGDFERSLGSDILKKTPDSLKDIANQVLKINDLGFFNKYYKKSEIMYIDFWNGSEEISYHFDTINGADTLILIYLTEEIQWQKDWGGQISLRKQLNDRTVVEKEIDPLNGTMIVLDNSNPLVTHKVTELKNKNVNRYTFSFSYKWF